MFSSLTSIVTFQKRVGEMLPSLSKAEANVLGLLSFGILLFDGCGISRLSHGLAKLEQVPAGRLRQRLREFCYEAEAKRGKKRREVKVEACFADLLRAVLREWEGKKELALAMDAMTLGERFTVLSISVVYRGCRMTIAWKIIKAGQEGAWRPHWEGLLAALEGVVPPDWKVIVMADRGLYAAWLYQAIQRLGWHPMLRVNEDLSFRATGEENFSPMGQRVKRRGRGWKGKGEWSEHGEQMSGTVLMCWEKGYEEKLVVVTDLDEKEANAAWYQMRFWIEDEYKDHKSGGWGWEQTKMTDPKRAERQWLARAVAMQIAVQMARARGGNRARAQTPGSQARKRETPGRKTTKTSVSATSTRTKCAHGRPANHSDNHHAWRRDPGGTRGERRVAQTDLCGCQADQELGQEVPREGGQTTVSQEQAGANLSRRETGSWHCCP